MDYKITFYDVDGTKLRASEEVMPIPLYKGMKLTIHGYHESYEVVDWNFHFGHPDEDAGLRIILKAVG